MRRKEKEPPANLEELRQRKAEELEKLKEGKKKNINGWKNVQRRKRRYKEQLVFENKVTYYVANLPHGCTREGLWAAFEKYDNLMEASVAQKKDRWGYTFGFLSFVEVADPVEFQKELEAIKVDGRKTWMTISKFGKGATGSHLPPPPKPNFMEDLTAQKAAAPLVPNTNKKTTPIIRNPWIQGTNFSYREVTKQKDVDTPAVSNIEIKGGGGRSETHPLKEVSLLGKVHNLALLDKLNLYLMENDGRPEFVIRYLGGLFIVLTFETKEEAKGYLDQKVHEWSTVFSCLNIWDGSSPMFERVAWLTITGIPPHLFERETINLIGSWCGRVVQESKACLTQENLSYDKIAVITNQGEKIKKSLTISYHNSKFRIWIKEDNESWVPSFLYPEGKPRSRDYGGFSVLSSNDSDQYQAESGHSAVGCAGHRPLDFESDFEASMATRPTDSSPLALNAAHEAMNNDFSAPEGRVSKQKVYDRGPMPIISVSGEAELNMEAVWANIFGVSESEKGSGSYNGPATQQGHSQPSEPFLQQDHVQTSGPTTVLGFNQADVLSSQQECDKGACSKVDSDPFNLGPLIDEIMISHKNIYKPTRGVVSKTRVKQRAARTNQQKVKPSNTNEGLGAISMFKLSRFLLNNQRMFFKRKGRNKSSTSANEEIRGSRSCPQTAVSTGTPHTQLVDTNINHLDSFFRQDVQIEEVLQDEFLESNMVNQNLQKPNPITNPEGSTRVNQNEVEDTILINSLVHIDLNGFQKQVEELIIEEGENIVCQ
ncbi:hypothetical protein QVD17_18789 [Tagetes erecta]|uniref:RRM domain-containing protein n=1 Tax=Tagetes erecta TaxID=13708 RepID=A0AAD8KLC6_TARER|nr:hypothetical protein QVD17_18789 [Tagetes erecta]